MKTFLRAFYWEILKQIVQIYLYIENVHPHIPVREKRALLAKLWGFEKSQSLKPRRDLSQLGN